MATWGKKEIRINKYEPKSTMYYEYNTTVDAYYFKTIWNEDFGLGNERFETEEHMGNQMGEAKMEALINHILAFECSGDVERFVDRYIRNNRFKNAKESAE